MIGKGEKVCYLNYLVAMLVGAQHFAKVSNTPIDDRPDASTLKILSPDWNNISIPGMKNLVK
jgi:hypothetical protein